MRAETKAEGTRTVVRNRRALHDYFILERLEAGLSLRGSEVKSLRDGGASLQDAFVELAAGEAWLKGCHIAPYAQASILNHDPLRRRKLLLHKTEIVRLARKVEEKGFTAIPLAIYFKGGLAKVEIGLARGKRQVDKRESIKRRDADREAHRELSARRRIRE